MPIKFDFYKTPVAPGGKKKERYHARIVGGRTVETPELAKLIQKHCTLTPADIRGALAALSDAIVEQLKTGNRVHLEGVGYFQMTLECPETRQPKDTHAQQIRFKSVKFRADSFLKEDMETDVHFVHSDNALQSATLSDIAIDGKLIDYFQDARFLTRPDFERVCYFTKSMALKHLKRLVAEGKLENAGTRHNPIYVPTPGNYGAIR